MGGALVDLTGPDALVAALLRRDRDAALNVVDAWRTGDGVPATETALAVWVLLDARRPDDAATLVGTPPTRHDRCAAFLDVADALLAHAVAGPGTPWNLRLVEGALKVATHAVGFCSGRPLDQSGPQRRAVARSFTTQALSVVLLGQPDLALAVLDRLGDLDDGQRAAADTVRALALLAKGDAAAARDLRQRQTVLDPDDPARWVLDRRLAQGPTAW